MLQDYEYKTFQNFTNAEDACLLYQVVDNINKMVWIDRSVYFYYQNLDSSTHVRLSPKALGSIAQAINIKLNICEKYNDLDRDLCKSIFLSYKNLEFLGYNHDGMLSQLFKKYELGKYTTFKNIWSSLSFRDLVKLLINYYYSNSINIK